MNRRLTILALITLTSLTVTALAQQIVSTGHSLDANLRLGSGGYNGASGRGGVGAGGGRPFRETLYRGQLGHIDYHTAFRNERRYDPTRATAFGDDHRRFEEGRDFAGTSRFGEGYDKGYEAGLVDGAEQAQLPEQARHQMEAISYAMGYFLGEEVRAGLDHDGVEADTDSVIRGFRDGLFDNLPQVPRTVFEELLADLHGNVEARLVEGLQARDPKFRKLAEDNLARSREFHEQFGRRAGVVTLPDGLQYQVLESGQGSSPGPDDYVVVTYKVVQLDGTILSEGTGDTVRVGGVVDGAARLLQMMTPGSRWLIAIPPEHAHGPGGKYPEIGPNITLFGEIELVENLGPQRPD